MSAATAPACFGLFVGVDIAAKSAAVALLSSGQRVQKSFAIKQDPAGFDKLKQHLLATAIPPAQILVLMEATSTYWIQLASNLHQAGFAIAVVNPAQGHDFAKSLLKRNKSDPVDAQTLAELALLLTNTQRLQLWSPPPQVYHELQQRLNQRDGLLKLRQQLKNQLHALSMGGIVVASVVERQNKLIATLAAEIDLLEQELAQVVETDASWAASVKLLQSIKGVGLLTACLLVAGTLNYSLTETAGQAAAYAGLVPRERSSGSSIRGKPGLGTGGNRRLRQALYMASMSAVRYNPVLKLYYEQLVARGKPKKVARCAVMRKMAGIAWAVVTKGTPFDPNYGQKAAPSVATP